MRIIAGVSRLLSYLAIGLLILLMLVTVSDVFLRYAFNSPILGAQEIAKLIMVCLVIGMAWCALRGEHIKVDLVMKRFPPRFQGIVKIFTLLASLVMCVIITWRSCLTAVVHLERGEVTSTIFPAPTFPSYAIFVLGWGVFCLVLAIILIQKIAETVKK